jgi:hypothetical protein
MRQRHLPVLTRRCDSGQGNPAASCSLVAILLTAVPFFYGTFVLIESAQKALNSLERVSGVQGILHQQNSGFSSAKQPSGSVLGVEQLERFDPHHSAHSPENGH